MAASTKSGERGRKSRSRREAKEGAGPTLVCVALCSYPGADSGEPVATDELEQRPPSLVVFSLAGGVGKTCLVATLGRALSALGEHVLLADTAACGLLPFYFGSRELRPGVVRTFSPPGSPSGVEGDAPVQVLNLRRESVTPGMVARA